jgi:hypothetical protein
MFTDDFTFAPHKRALFQLVVLVRDTKDIASALNLGFMSTISQDLISCKGVSIVVEDLTAIMPQALCLDREQSILRVVSGKEFVKSQLCADRPAPQYYDEMRIGKDVPGARFLIVRMDRFIFDACESLEEFKRSLDHLSTVSGTEIQL